MDNPYCSCKLTRCWTGPRHDRATGPVRDPDHCHRLGVPVRRDRPGPAAARECDCLLRLSASKASKAAAAPSLGRRRPSRRPVCVHQPVLAPQSRVRAWFDERQMEERRRVRRPRDPKTMRRPRPSDGSSTRCITRDRRPPHPTQHPKMLSGAVRSDLSGGTPGVPTRPTATADKCVAGIGRRDGPVPAAHH